MRDFNEEAVVGLEIPGRPRWVMEEGGLPYYPADLLEAAIEDFVAMAKTPGYSFNMGTWHDYTESHGYGKCSICLAGSVMANRLGTKRTDSLCPEDYAHLPTKSRFSALDQMRQGSVKTGLSFMGFSFLAHPNLQEDLYRVRLDYQDSHRDTTGRDFCFGDKEFDRYVGFYRQTVKRLRRHTPVLVNPERAGCAVLETASA